MLQPLLQVEVPDLCHNLLWPLTHSKPGDCEVLQAARLLQGHLGRVLCTALQLAACRGFGVVVPAAHVEAVVLPRPTEVSGISWPGFERLRAGHPHRLPHFCPRGGGRRSAGIVDTPGPWEQRTGGRCSDPAPLHCKDHLAIPLNAHDNWLRAIGLELKRLAAGGVPCQPLALADGANSLVQPECQTCWLRRRCAGQEPAPQRRGPVLPEVHGAKRHEFRVLPQAAPAHIPRQASQPEARGIDGAAQCLPLQLTRITERHLRVGARRG
mmetsp:Transcript_82260/g.228285  ORF Transcript_82260/g.228285 Transcript_82260/m.228285 type:complete len:268 (+) Transcript_82260:654-1457(+)